MKIAIVKLSAMGDIVHAMVALQYLKAHDPSMTIDWVVEEAFAPLLAYNPHIDNILPVRLKALKHDRTALFSEMKKVRAYAQKKYDLVIDAQGLLKSAIVSRLLGSNVAGFDRHSIRETAASWFYAKRFSIPYEMNVVLRNVTLLLEAVEASSNVDISQKDPFLFYTKEDGEKTASFYSKNDPNILYIMGSSWESKVYPQDAMSDVVAGLGGNALLAWGSGEEKKRAESIAKVTGARVLPALDLNELKAAVDAADLVIGGDSGPTHMAWAMNRPSITIFGPTPSSRNTYLTAINRVVDCGNRVDPHRLDRHDRCIGTIPPEKIIEQAQELLA